MHNVDRCPAIRIGDDGIELTHLVDNCTVNWMEETATKYKARTTPHVESSID